MVCYLQGVTPSSGNEKNEFLVTVSPPKIDLQQIRDGIEKRQLEVKIIKQQKRINELTNAARKVLNQSEMKKLEEKEQALLREKEELERLLAAKQMPKNYQLMSTSSLLTELWKAEETNSPDKAVIHQELQKRLANSFIYGL
ncbi:hypothetical protein IKP85_01105 [bacterium]|nr:hypothetical protein [bacterium]